VVKALSSRHLIVQPEHRAALLQRLQSGANELSVSLDADQLARLIDYLSLLHHWNRKHNLTAVRDIDQMVTRHLLDSLAVHDYLKAGNLLDVGTGAGLPGIPLAIAKPDLTVTLLDSVSKKTRFMLFAVSQLQLKNAEVIHQRVEGYRDAKFQQIIARAFAAPEKLLSLTAHLLDIEGCVIAMTAATALKPGDELSVHSAADNSAASVNFRVSHSEQLRVPTDNAERNVVIFERA